MRERFDRRRLAALERDAALARTGRARRWAIAATAGLTAVFAGVVWAVAPGRSLGAKRATASAPATSTSAPASGSSTAMPPLASPSQLGLQSSDDGGSQPASQPAQSASQPAQPAPQPVQPAPQPAQPAPVVSGGS